MINKYTNKQRGLLAVIMAMVMVFAGVAITVSDDIDAAAKTTYISGEINSSQTFDGDTIVIVNDDLRVIGGASLIIGLGAQFTVNEGVTLTIGDATGTPASMTVDKDAYVVIDGTLVVGEGASVNVECGNPTDTELKNHGFYVNGNVNVIKGGSFTTTEFNENAYIDGYLESLSGVFFKDDSTLSVTSSGTKISEISGFITLMDGATFKMAGLATNDLYIISADSNILGNVEKKTANLPAIIYVKGNAYEEGMTSGKVSNYTIKSSISTENVYIYNTSSKWISDYSIKAKVASLDISGTIQNNDEVETYVISADDVLKYVVNENILDDITDGLNLIISDKEGKSKAVTGEITINEALVVVKTGMFAGGYGALVVSGTLAVDDEAKVALYNADITITGEVNLYGTSLYQGAVATSDVKIDGGIVKIMESEGLYTVNSYYGAMYSLTSIDDGDTVTYLCDLEVAIAAATENTDIDSVYVFAEKNSEINVGNDYKGGYIVKESFDVPADLNLYVSNALIVGEDIVINIPETATVMEEIAGAKIVVKGKIIDKSLTLSVVDEGMVVCQVLQTTDEGATQIFTSLKLALRDAVAGDVIELVGEVVVKDALTIPAGVTIDTAGNNIIVEKGAVLTVDGTIDNRDDGQIILNKGDEFTDDGKIVVNNIVVDPTIVYNNTNSAAVMVAGIYATGTIGDYEEETFILAPAVAAENSSVISNATVDAETTYNGDLTFTAGEDNTAVLTVNSKFTVGTITIVGYEIIISNVDSDNDSKADAIFTGKVAATNGALDLKNVKSVTDIGKEIVITNVVDEDAGTDVLTIAGKPVMVDKDGKVVNDSKKNVASISIASGTVTVDKSAILDVSNLGFTVAEGTVLDVNGTVTFNKMTISGTTNINGALTSTNGVLEVLGTLFVKQATADDGAKGTVTVNGDVFVGVLKKSVVSGTATIDAAEINGCKIMYVAAGSSIPEDMVKDVDSIQFIIEDSLYITAYNMGKANDATATINKAPVENAKFLGWNDDKGKLITDGDNADYSIDFATYDKVTAAIDYNIYSVYIVADNGIGTVAIDGIVLQKNGNTFSASKLVAGEHTLSYELKNGYEGTVKMTVDGKAVDGYKFTLSGTDAEDLSIDINLSGTTQIEYSTATDSGEDDGGMTLVEILLIVLVVLVVILAVIVALRMMRS